MIKTRQTQTKQKYRIVDALGRGGFSIVLKVIDVGTGDAYAMKKINKKNYTTSYRMNSQLDLELQVMRELSKSPFIQPAENIFEDDAFLYIIFEQLYGDLFYHLSSWESQDERRGPSKKQSKIMLAEICLALEHLHQHNFIHRDLKVMIFPHLPFFFLIATRLPPPRYFPPLPPPPLFLCNNIQLIHKNNVSLKTL
jgi:serine/threonine protein kinase